jgi:hypothetical protein
MITSKALSYSFPHVSHCAMGISLLFWRFFDGPAYGRDLVFALSLVRAIPVPRRALVSSVASKATASSVTLADLLYPSHSERIDFHDETNQ